MRAMGHCAGVGPHKGLRAVAQRHGASARLERGPGPCSSSSSAHGAARRRGLRAQDSRRSQSVDVLDEDALLREDLLAPLEEPKDEDLQQKFAAAARLLQERGAGASSGDRWESAAEVARAVAPVASTSGRDEPIARSGLPAFLASLRLPAPVQAVLDALSPRTRGLIMLNVLVLLVATNWVVVKDAGELTSPFTFAFLRFAVAAVAFSPFLLKAIRDPLVTKAGLELGFWTAAGYLLQAMGLLSTDASRASFLSTFTVLVVPFLSGMKGERVSPVTLACAAAAVVGVGLLEQTGAEPGIGDVWSFLSAVAFGVQVFRTEHWARLLQQADADDVSVEGSSQSTLPLMSVVLFTTMVLSAAAAVISDPSMVLEAIKHPLLTESELANGDFPWAPVLWTGIVTTDLCLLLELIALRDVPSTDAAIIYTLEPVLGAAFAYVALGERWGPIGWVGAGLIVASTAFAQLHGKEEAEESVSIDAE